jgi:hypothetical protein
MFDRFKPFENVQKQKFSFQPTRFETWKDAKMIDSGKTNSLILADVIKVDGEEKVKIQFKDQNLNDQLAIINEFDEFITSSDRLQLITIPKETTAENTAIMMFRMNLGYTREIKHFNETEPFCCNLFLQDGKIVKITFSFNNPEKLIEFYDDANMKYETNLATDIFSSLRNDFDTFRKQILDLPSNSQYRCDVFNSKGEKLVNNENGYLEIYKDKIILRTYDDSNDYIEFYNQNEKLFCKYVIMNGKQIIINDAFDKVEFKNKEIPNVEMCFIVPAREH